jgi:hypothetical protein
VKAPTNKAPPVSKKVRPIPGAEYETATPPPPAASVDETPLETPVVEEQPAVMEEEPVASPPADVEETPSVEPLVENAG